MSYELIYSSRMTADIAPGDVAGIVEHARVKNRRLDITGLMAFDGAHFCQLLEGAMGAVDQLAATINKDRRHERFTVLHAGERRSPRRFPASPMAFALYDLNSLPSAIAQHAGAQMADFMQSTHPMRIDAGA